MSDIIQVGLREDEIIITQAEFAEITDLRASLAKVSEQYKKVNELRVAGEREVAALKAENDKLREKLLEKTR